MSLPASDAFTEASDTALTSHTAGGITWVNNSGAFQVKGTTDDIISNSSSNETGAHDSTNTYNNNQYAQVKCNATGSGDVGVAVRCASGATATYYGFYWGATDSYKFKNVAGTWSQLGSTGGAATVGRTYKLVADGTSIYVLENGASFHASTTDSSISSGYAGVSGWGISTGRADDFAADNITVATKAKPIYQRHTLYVWRSR